jgi:DNA-binding IclR family transcriptional regulator
MTTMAVSRRSQQELPVATDTAAADPYRARLQQLGYTSRSSSKFDFLLLIFFFFLGFHYLSSVIPSPSDQN